MMYRCEHCKKTYDEDDVDKDEEDKEIAYCSKCGNILENLGEGF